MSCFEEARVVYIIDMFFKVGLISMRDGCVNMEPIGVCNLQVIQVIKFFNHIINEQHFLFTNLLLVVVVLDLPKNVKYSIV